MSQDKEFEDLVRFRGLLILGEEELKNRGRLLKEVKSSLLNDNYLQIYERALVGKCAYVRPYIMSETRDFALGLSRVFMCGSSKRELSLYVDQDVNPVLYSENFSSTHPYYNVYILSGIRFTRIYDFLRDYMYKYQENT